MDTEYYITVFSLKFYYILKKKNIFPYTIETNKKFPQYKVFKYKNDPYILQLLDEYKRGELA